MKIEFFKMLVYLIMILIIFVDFIKQQIMQSTLKMSQYTHIAKNYILKFSIFSINAILDFYLWGLSK